MGQPGDPYAAQRDAARAQAVELFSAPGGGVNHYAQRVHVRLLADLHYMGRWRVVGPAQAGFETCEKFGHDQRGRQCERCGAQIGMGLR